MVKILQVKANRDPGGTYTVTVWARSETGGTIIGHSGGVPKEYVGADADRVARLLDISQNHVATIFANAGVPF